MTSAPSWTISKLLKWTTDFFAGHGIDAPRCDAEILLSHVLQVRRIDLYLRYDQPLNVDELARFKGLIKRRVRREPVAYIVGRRGFWSLDLAVSPAVLIPRPETERLVEESLKYLGSAGPPRRVLELGTGSGAVILALAQEQPRHFFCAVDRSAAALRIAAANAAAVQAAGRVHFFCGDWLSALSPRAPAWDLVASNPPYIASADIAALQPEIRSYEPRPALDGGPSGTRALAHIIRQGHRYLTSGGMLLLEIGADQKPALLPLIEAAGAYGRIRFEPDYAGRDRILVLQKK